MAVFIAALLAWYLSSSVAQESHPIGLLSSIEFLALYLGSPFFHGYNERVLATDHLIVPLVAGYSGLLVACGVAVRILRLRKRRALDAAELFFVGVMTFSLVAGAMAAVVRGGGGHPAPALASRYGVLCLLFWLSAVPLAVAGIGFVRVRVLAAVAPICLLALLAGSQVRYLGWWLSWRSMIEGATASLVSNVPDPDYLGYINNRADLAERVAAALVRKRLSPLEDRTFALDRSAAAGSGARGRALRRGRPPPDQAARGLPVFGRGAERRAPLRSAPGVRHRRRRPDRWHRQRRPRLVRGLEAIRVNADAHVARVRAGQ